jgi:hypothetical protein
MCGNLRAGVGGPAGCNGAAKGASSAYAGAHQRSAPVMITFDIVSAGTENLNWHHSILKKWSWNGEPIVFSNSIFV